MSTSTNTATYHATAKMLPRIYRSKMSTSTNTATYHATAKMFPRIYRSKMSSYNTYNLFRETFMFHWIDRPEMLFSPSSNLPASCTNNTASSLSAWQ
jgi:hypothetical protein